MSETRAVILFVVAFSTIIAWWLYMTAQARRKTDALSTAMKRNGWRPFTPNDDLYKPDLPRKHFAYRVYYQFVNAVFRDSGDCCIDDTGCCDKPGE